MQEKVEQTLQRALQAMQANDSEATLALLREAAQLAPDSAIPPFLLACEYAQSRQYERAEEAYFAALELQPDLAIARFQLVLLQFTSGRPAAARASWQGLNNLAEAHPLRLFKNGLESLAMDRFDEARLALQRGMEANHDNPPLNRDMQLMIERIDAHQQRSGASRQDGVDKTTGTSASNTPATAQAIDPGATDDASGTARFLLSRYRTLQ